MRYWKLHKRVQGRRRRHHPATWNFGPWAWEGRFFDPGEISLALLSLLKEGPKHGYELMRDLEQRSGVSYRASAGTIYPKLQELLDLDLVTATSQEGGKRVYTLTAEGRSKIEQEAETIDKMWKRADHEEWGDWGRDTTHVEEVLRPAFRLMKAAFGAVQRGDGARERIEGVRAVLEKARAEIEAMV